jgi:opacity protein-like surface antigen
MILLTAFTLSLAPDGARAEGYADLYLGGAFAPDTSTKITPKDPATLSEVDFDGSMLYGGRVGYWFDSVPWLGFALTASYYNADEDARGTENSRLEIGVIPVSALLTLRYPLLKSSDFPQGQVYPYVGVGPGMFMTKVRQQLTGVNKSRQIRDSSVEVGVDLRAGIGFFYPNESWYYFTEYRFTHVGSSNYKENIGVPAELRLGSMDTHSFVFGVGYHF